MFGLRGWAAVPPDLHAWLLRPLGEGPAVSCPSHTLPGSPSAARGQGHLVAVPAVSSGKETGGCWCLLAVFELPVGSAAPSGAPCGWGCMHGPVF